MQEAMVTARMSKAKKEAGTRVLKSLGQTPSQAINEFYDYLINEHENPCAKNPKKMQPGIRKFTPEEIEKGRQFFNKFKGFHLPPEVASWTKEDIRRERLIDRGLLR